MSTGADLTAEVRARMAADGVDMTAQVPVNDPGGSPAQGTGEGQPTPTAPVTSPAGVSNADDGSQTGPPETIPYSRFSEVNGRLRDLQPYEVLQTMGIDPDSAVRLASFEQEYMRDPRGTLSALIDQQSDLPDSQKTALKALLDPSGSVGDVARTPEGNGDDPVQLPAEDRELLDWARNARSRESEQESQARLDLVVRHWQQQDERDGITVPPRQRLLYIQGAAGSGQQFQTLEQLSDAARAQFLEDRDLTLGSAVTHRGTGTPRTVPSGGLPPTPPIVPRTMGEARKLIEADIKAGRLPDLSPE
jgi:hypothetical protein